MTRNCMSEYQELLDTVSRMTEEMQSKIADAVGEINLVIKLLSTTHAGRVAIRLVMLRLQDELI